MRGEWDRAKVEGSKDCRPQWTGIGLLEEEGGELGGHSQGGGNEVGQRVT